MTVANLERQLSEADRRKLLRAIEGTLEPLSVLSADESFRFSEITGYLERALHDWCEVAGPHVVSAKE